MIRYSEEWLQRTHTDLVKIYTRNGLIYHAVRMRRVVIDYDPCGRNEYGWEVTAEWRADD